MFKNFIKLYLTLISTLYAVFDSILESDCRHYNYCKLGGAAIYSISTGAQFSLGRRYEEYDHAVDISASYFKAPNGQSFSIPRISYIFYSNPESS